MSCPRRAPLPSSCALALGSLPARCWKHSLQLSVASSCVPPHDSGCCSFLQNITRLYKAQGNRYGKNNSSEELQQRPRVNNADKPGGARWDSASPPEQHPAVPLGCLQGLGAASCHRSHQIVSLLGLWHFLWVPPDRNTRLVHPGGSSPIFGEVLAQI